MAFNGSLLKSGNDEFPVELIYKESYKVVPNRRQDLDPYRDANGKLHRNTLSHTASTIEFQTKPMWNNDFETVMAWLRSHYSVDSEKKIPLTYYCPDTNSYSTGNFYVPDIEITMNYVDTTHNKILYESATIEFIEY